MQKWTQDLWKAVVAEVERLHGSMNQKQTSMENLSQEVLESKKFLWEELEDVQAEMRLIYQKLKDQEVDITRNLVNIKKLRENQVRCTKFLAQLRNRGDASETVDHKPGNNKGNDDVCTHCKSLSSYSIRSEKSGPRMRKQRSHPHPHPKASSPVSFMSDSALHQHRGNS
ncbi:coiled-coil domain-containing protein 159 isoform X2 [Sphaerodactylus townsendi]|uniref:Uncharacterized protein n=1 Tax=Sphaerodactylus townsendi TaxID=933632 RepID=A0ACB8ENB4_9SAUR|nr:coiled-coil domain-containing protein 159 isoform X2 [Sphaerodactylus townsendi]